MPTGAEEAVIGWLVKKVAFSVFSLGISSLSSMYENTQAFNEFESLLNEANKQRPAECTIGTVSQNCPVEGQAQMLYDPRAGGTHLWKMYIVRTMRGEYLQIQFFESAGKVFVWQYDAQWNLVEKGTEIDPIEALKKLKSLSGLGVIGASPHLK